MAAGPPQPADPVARVLREVFGFHGFRPNQEPIVRAILQRRDAFAVMPTGGGKSLCYQLPARLLDGTGLVVSPLISLMKDQVDAANQTGLRAEFFNSTLSAGARTAVLDRLGDGELDLLYIAPERFATDGFAALLQRVRLCLIAVDEAHCISEWGHDFRPDYLALSRLVEMFPDVPVAAFTATATPQVQQDTIDRLGLRDPLVVRASFDRPNLTYRVTPKTDADAQVLELVRARPDQPGIVYRTTRKDTEATAGVLRGHGIAAAAYHAGMDADARQTNQEAFVRDEVQVVVATIAFGMGIDKSNVRFVVHADLPKNIEGYYQETGRAGRDGEPADCILLYGPGDKARLRYFIRQIADDTERAVAADKLADMIRYATANVCRRRQLLGYFGEDYPAVDCGACDLCLGEREQTDATTDARKLLSAVIRTGERYGTGYIIEIVTGADSERVRTRGHDQLPTWGVGAELPRGHWQALIADLIAQDCLRYTEDGYRVLKLTPRGRDVLFGRAGLYVLRRPDRKAPRTRRRARRTALPPTATVDESLFERLRALRLRLARQQHVPPYIVFSDRTLREMAAVRPDSLPAMSDITGVGQRKLDRYGEVFLREIAAHRGAE